MPSINFHRLGSRLVLLLLLVLTFQARTHNAADVFHGEPRAIYFIEGDCYSRMTRAKMVTEGNWTIRHHDFENYPAGTTPHTTAPFDWLIVGLKSVCDLAVRIVDRQGTSVLHTQTLDLAGALISPVLGVITAAWLWWWGGRMRLPFRSLMVLFFALSSILVHGTILGRPDHQSLLILLLAIAVGAEFVLADLGTPRKLAWRWAYVAGIAWGIALWVSLYEPLLFFAGAVGRHLIFNTAALTSRIVRGRWYAIIAIAMLALLIDGWRLSFPDKTLREYFLGWSSTIGELEHLDLRTNAIWRWTGWFCGSAPVLLWLAGRRDKRAFSVLLLIAVMLSLSLWQKRWGYFLALAVALSIPWQLGVVGLRWRGWAAGALGLLPFYWGWIDILQPSDEQRERHEWNRAAQEELRHLAEAMRGPEKLPFIAPWWISPHIAYWSGQPGIAGTSHQSLAGIVDGARFFLAPTPQDGAAILQKRQARIVIVDSTTDAAGQLPFLSNARAILGSAQKVDEPLGALLAAHPRLAPSYLRYIEPKSRGLVLEIGKSVGNTPDPSETKFHVPYYYEVFAVEPDKL